MKDIPGYEGLYAASEDGQIWSYYNNIWLSQKCRKDGYYEVSLYKNGKAKSKQVHQLIALTYIPNPENKPTVDHIDRDKTNNAVSNLRWNTYSEQIKNSDNPFVNHPEYQQIGAKVVSKAVEQRDINNHNILYNTYPSSCAAAKALFNDSSKNSLINRCANGKKPSAYGYWWCFVNNGDEV